MKLYLLLLLLIVGLGANAQSAKLVSSGAEQTVKVLKFYPNPATSVINFEFQKSFEKGYVIQIYNFIGKKISETSALNSKTSVILNDFYRGVYIFQLRDKNGHIVESGKFQVIK